MRQRHFCDLTRKRGALRRPITKGRSEAVHSHMSITNAPQEHRHRHLRKRPAQLRARKHKLVLPDLHHLGNYLAYAWRQRHAMVPSGFHPFGRNCPKPALKVDLAPTGSQNFARATCRESGTQECARKDWIAAATNSGKQGCPSTAGPRGAPLFGLCPSPAGDDRDVHAIAPDFYRLDSHALSPNSRSPRCDRGPAMPSPASSSKSAQGS